MMSGSVRFGSNTGIGTNGAHNAFGFTFCSEGCGLATPLRCSIWAKLGRMAYSMALPATFTLGGHSVGEVDPFPKGPLSLSACVLGGLPSFLALLAFALATLPSGLVMSSISLLIDVARLMKRCVTDGHGSDFLGYVSGLLPSQRAPVLLLGSVRLLRRPKASILNNSPPQISSELPYIVIVKLGFVLRDSDLLQAG
jgi:hypothetical protein